MDAGRAKRGVANKPSTEENICGVRNTALSKASGSVKIKNTTGSGLVTHQVVEL